MDRKTFAAALLAGTFLTGSAYAATIEVHDGESIQAALDAANPGDTVAVHAGTYNESVTFKGSGIKLSSVDGVGAAHIQSTGTPLFVMGGENKEVSGFKLSAGKGGNGIQLGGTVSNFASGYVIKNNVINTAGEDGIKAHQLDNSVIGENQILNAGTSNNSNHDGGIDFVAVAGTDLIGNVIEQTGGNSCLMLKGGSTDNDITGNTFSGCKNAVHVGGLTTDKFMAPGSNGLEAYDNSITGNKFSSSDCAIYTFGGTENNTISGNEIAQGGGCSSEGGGGKLDETPVDYSTGGGSYGGGGDSYSDSSGQYGGMKATLVSSSGGEDKCSSAAMEAAMGAISGIAGLFGGGRSTAPAQLAQQIQLMWANQCSASQNDKLGLSNENEAKLLEYQRRNIAPGTADPVAGIDSLTKGITGVMTNGGFLSTEQAIGEEIDGIYPNIFDTMPPDDLISFNDKISQQGRQAHLTSIQAQNRMVLEQISGIGRVKEYAAAGRAGEGIRAELQAANAINSEVVATVNLLTNATVANHRAMTELELRKEARKEAANQAAEDFMSTLSKCEDCTPSKPLLGN